MFLRSGRDAKAARMGAKKASTSIDVRLSLAKAPQQSKNRVQKAVARVGLANGRPTSRQQIANSQPRKGASFVRAYLGALRRTASAYSSGLAGSNTLLVSISISINISITNWSILECFYFLLQDCNSGF